MQLDRTQIAIRERGLWELLDLALRVTVYYFKPLVLCTAFLAIPFAIFNWWATHWIVADEFSGETISRNIWIMTQLVFLEAPLASVVTTLFLGRVMFLQEVSYSALLKEAWKFAPRIFWSQMVVRGGLLTFVFACALTAELEVGPAEIFLPFYCFIAAGFRATRPFVNEIILLERNPIRSADEQTITIGRRSRSLHGPSTGDLIAHWLLTAVIGSVLVACIAATLWFVAGVLSNHWQWRTLMVEILVPLAMWIVVVFMTVVRFLNYLDLRIRREGWEVELKVRAAANELGGQLA